MIRLKVRIIGIFVLCCAMLHLSAKEVKPTLLVYGSGIEAFAAALQAARSNVPTLWVVDESTYLEEFGNRTVSVTSNVHLLGGIWKDLMMETGQLVAKDDSTVAVMQRDINPQLLRNALERMVGKEKNLIIVTGVAVIDVSKSKKELKVTLSNRRKYDVRAMVDATPTAESSKFIAATDLLARSESVRTVAEMTAEQRRTLVAIGAYDNAIYGYTWSDLLAKSTSTIFYVAGLVQVGSDDNSLPLRANLGQAIGASAAYCSFFKTDAEKVDVRKLQTELLAFDARILPFLDITSSCDNYRALEKVFLVSILPLESKEGEMMFNGDNPVKVAAVKDVINNLYSRSQLWFVDNTTKEYFELKDLLGLIKYVSFRGDEVDREVEKEWSRKLKFKGAYDPIRVVSRYEFAVLLDRYANPYVKAIASNGRILR